MTREEAIRMLKAKLECMTRDVSGKDDDCNNHRCDECPLNYEQGNMGEQKEWLKMSIEALKLQPNEEFDKASSIQKNTAKWVETGIGIDCLGHRFKEYKCSKCGNIDYSHRKNKFCPECGRRMKG